MTDQIIDVSHHNGRIDWGQVKPNIAGAVLRMGYRGYSGGKSNGSHTGRSDKLSKEDRTNMLLSLRTYIKMIRPAWGVGIYASQSWFYDNLSLARLYQAKVPLWVARWGKVPDIMCEMWQYSDKGSVPGISGNVDLNRIGGV